MTAKPFRLVRIAVIAALYALFTYLTAAFGLAYGPVQFRLSECMMILAAFTPDAVWGLAAGCFLANLTSPCGVIDLAVGTAATLLATLILYRVAKRIKNLVPLCVAAVLITTVVNGIAVGLEITLLAQSEAGVVLFLVNALEVAAGEAAVTAVGCYPLALFIQRSQPLSRFFIQK